MAATLKPNALTTPDRLRELTGCDEADAVLIRKINSISRRLETICGRRFGFSVYTTDEPLLLEGSGTPELFLDHRPIRAVEQVVVSGQVWPVEIVSGQSAITPFEAKVYRTKQWDREGKLYFPLGWGRLTGIHNDLTGDANYNPAWQMSNILISFTGGWILPQFDEIPDPEHNPDGLPSDLPDDLEEAVSSEINNSLDRPNRGLVMERTPGGYQQQWQQGEGSEFSTKNAGIFASYCVPGALWA